MSIKYIKGFYNKNLGPCNLCYKEIVLFGPEELAKEFNKL